MNPLNPPSMSSETAPDPNDILADTVGLFTRSGTLLSGQVVERGAALGKVTVSGKLKWSASADGDGSQTIIAVAAEDVDASGGDKPIMYHLRANLKENMVKFNTGHTLAANVDVMAARGLCLYRTGLY